MTNNHLILKKLCDFKKDCTFAAHFWNDTFIEYMTKLEGYLKQFVLQFSGLKLGFHEYEFEIVDLFFEQYAIEDVDGGNIHVNFTLEKRENMMELSIKMAGTLKTICDRCLDPMVLATDTEDQVMIKFGSETNSDNEELLVLGPEAYQIDIAPFLYEFITVQFPLRKVHDEDDCDPAVIEKLQEALDTPEEDDDTPNMWDELKKLK